MFDVDNRSWREKGRGLLRLNDMCHSSSEITQFQSRLGKILSICNNYYMINNIVNAFELVYFK